MAAHHRLILETADRISKTPYGRAMFFTPPGAAKSTYASIVFPSYYMGKNPGSRIILGSYGNVLARKMGRRTRGIIQQKQYWNLFGARLRSDTAGAQEFALTNGSEYMASGLLAGITGARANGIVIDDPVKGREQADSLTVRDKTWDAYEDDLKTRLLPGGWIFLIQTRWNEDDVAGRILPEGWKGESGPILCRDGNIWEVVCLQARCEVLNDPLGRKFGDYLWPEWFDAKHWAQFESNPRTWSALYQQLPKQTKGTLFNEADMLVDGQPVAYPNNCDSVFATMDTAFKGADRNDGTAVCFWARSKHAGHPLILLDWDIVQIDGDLLPAWVPAIFVKLEDLAQKTGARGGNIGLWIEDAAAGVILIQQGKRTPNSRVHALDSKLTSLSKDARGLAVSGYVYKGDVKMSAVAYNKVTLYKGRTQNHFLTQFFGYRLGVKDQADDLYDAGVYGISIALGDPKGY